MNCLACAQPLVPNRSARGLCLNTCWKRAKRAGTLEAFQRRAPEEWPNELLMEEWDMLRREGYTRAQAAERLGLKLKTLEKAIERHNKRVAA